MNNKTALELMNLPDLDDAVVIESELKTPEIKRYKHIEYIQVKDRLLRVCDPFGRMLFLVPIDDLEKEYQRDIAKSAEMHYTMYFFPSPFENESPDDVKDFFDSCSGGISHHIDVDPKDIG